MYQSRVEQAMNISTQIFIPYAETALFTKMSKITQYGHSQSEKSKEFYYHSMKVHTKRPRICINWNPLFQTQIYLVEVPLNVNIVKQDLLHKKQFLKNLWSEVWKGAIGLIKIMGFLSMYLDALVVEVRLFKNISDRLWPFKGQTNSEASCLFLTSSYIRTNKP